MEITPKCKFINILFCSFFQRLARLAKGWEETNPDPGPDRLHQEECGQEDCAKESGHSGGEQQEVSGD